jgi:hypothetical protein
MKKMTLHVTCRKGALLAAICGLFVLLGASVPVTTQTASGGTSGVPAFLRANSCYRLTFPIAGVPEWKVLEVLDHGWIRGEIDAGPPTAVREPVWINTRQIITAREARCSR